MASDMKTHYEVLGVDRDATEDDIKKSYRSLARMYHPDTLRQSTSPSTLSEQDADQMMKRINHAYDILSDPDKRARYDNGRNRQTSSATFNHPAYRTETTLIYESDGKTYHFSNAEDFLNTVRQERWARTASANWRQEYEQQVSLESLPLYRLLKWGITTFHVISYVIVCLFCFYLAWYIMTGNNPYLFLMGFDLSPGANNMAPLICALIGVVLVTIPFIAARFGAFVLQRMFGLILLRKLVKKIKEAFFVSALAGGVFGLVVGHSLF